MRSDTIGTEALVRIEPDQIVGIDVVELIARALVEHIRIDPVGPQQRDPLLALGALALQPRQLGGQGDDLLVELLLRVQAVFAGIGVDAKIADHGGRNRIEREPGKNGFESAARDHNPEHATAPVNGMLK